jgi:hypothetical protein
LYAVIALFDEKTDDFIRNLWQELSEVAISFYAKEIEDRIPHLTLASYEYLDESPFVQELDELYRGKEGIDILFNSLGSFLKSGALYLSPVMTEDLYTLHRKHHQAFSGYNDASSSFYLPGRWIPHCTLANRLSLGKLAEAFTYCQSRIDTSAGRITKIALIKVQGKMAPVIHSVTLK